MLLLDDGVGAVLHVLGDASLGLAVLVVAVELAELGQGNAGDRGAGPGYELGVTVLAHHVGVHVARVHVHVLAEHVAQAGGVEHGAGANDLGLG